MISDNKLKHIIGVARKCKSIAKEMSMSEEKQNAAFVMGFLHDIGYELCNQENITSHPQNGYNMINDYLKYKDEINDAIKFHGRKYENLTDMDIILNTADLTINHIGEEISMEERINDIKNRHGEDNVHTNHAIKQYEAIKKYKLK